MRYKLCCWQSYSEFGSFFSISDNQFEDHFSESTSKFVFEFEKKYSLGIDEIVRLESQI